MDATRLDYLLNCYVDEALSIAENHELETMLIESVEAREMFWTQVPLHGFLRDSYEASSGKNYVDSTGFPLTITIDKQDAALHVEIDDRVNISILANEPTSPPVLGFFGNVSHGMVGYISSGWPVAYLVAAVVVAVGLLIGAFTYVSHPVSVARQSVPFSSPPSSLPSLLSPLPSVVGRITGMIDCKWEKAEGGGRRAEKSPNLQISQILVSLGDKFNLASGLMEITYDTGAKVILQGPVTYKVDSKDGGFLSLGKLTARVDNAKPQAANPSSALRLPPSALFSVRTPTAIVTDLGTEFGVEVRDSGVTAAHVFRGVVEVQSTAHDGQCGQPIRLSENESARVEKDGNGPGFTVHRGVADPTAFVRVEPRPKLASKATEEQRLKPFRRWQTYSMELRKDSSLLAYYDFQQKPGEPTVLCNVAINGDKLLDGLDGVVKGATWTTGRMVGKHALQFNGPDDCVRINVPQEADNLTLAAWVCAYSLDNPLNGILMSDKWGQDGQAHWQLNSNGCVGFSVFDSVIRSKTEESAPVFDVKRLFRWTHLAAVYDREAAQIRFYADGSAMGEVHIIKYVPIRIGAARIGHWNSATMIDNKSTVRSFHGRIDELAIFGRALSHDEIQCMFEAGKPPDKNR